MTFYLLIMLVPLALLALFAGLVAYEERTGRRLLLAGRRYTLDRKAERLAFVARHVDWGAFMNDLARSGIERLLHDVAHNILIGVRFLERELTHLVRTLRTRRTHPGIAAPRDDEQKPSRVAALAAHMRQAVRRSRRQLPAGRREGEE